MVAKNKEELELNTKTVMISWVEYSLSSDPQWLRKLLKEQNVYDPEAKSWKVQKIYYIPFDIILELLEWLIWIKSYEASDMELVNTWEVTFPKTKDKPEEVKTVYQYRMRVKIETIDWRTLTVSRSRNAYETQLVKSDSLRWLEWMLEALCVKSICKKFWRVFRVVEIEEEWVDAESDTIASTQTSETTTPKAKQVWWITSNVKSLESTEKVQIDYDKLDTQFWDYLEWAYEANKKLTKEWLAWFAKQFKENALNDLWYEIVSWTKENKVLLEVFERFISNNWIWSEVKIKK